MSANINLEIMPNPDRERTEQALVNQEPEQFNSITLQKELFVTINEEDAAMIKGIFKKFANKSDILQKNSIGNAKKTKLIKIIFKSRPDFLTLASFRKSLFISK